MVLGIYGASGLGREVHLLAKRINQKEHRWSKIVFVDDNKEIKEVLGVKVYTFEEIKKTKDKFEIAIAVGEPAVREILYNKLKKEHVNVATLIYPDVYIDESTHIAEGTIVNEGVIITSCVKIEENIYIQPNAVIGHDIQIGKHSVIGSNCEIGGGDILGERVYMGYLSGILQGLKIGNDVICSAGAIVFRDIEDEMIVVGNPARVIKRNERKRVFS